MPCCYHNRWLAPPIRFLKDMVTKTMIIIRRYIHTYMYRACAYVIRDFLSFGSCKEAHLVPLCLSMLKNGSITPVRIKLSLDIASRSAMRNLVCVILLVATARAQYKYKICAPFDVVTEPTCLTLQRGDSEVSCLRVTDSAECAIRLAQGEADFGVFNAEELLLTYQFYPTQIQPIFQLRHKDRQEEEYEFQTVAVVPKDLTQINLPPGERLKRLRNSGFCHPGFSHAQWWNDYILKYFENSVNSPKCQDDVPVIENEVRNLRNFFGKACRPGEWATDSVIDQELKKKYPELCSLCDNKADCSYINQEHHGHVGALQCLTSGNGKVAYVALNYVRDYLRNNESYEFLCPTGTVLPLTTENPCAWLKQPWSVIAARREVVDSIKDKLSTWLKYPQTEPWIIALNSIVQENSFAFDIAGISIASYLSKGRDIDIENYHTCGKHIRWCTIGDMETNKCKWVAKATKALGIAPSFSCIKSSSTFQCLHEIKENRTDIIVIDSNYGYLARRVHDLSTVLYSETETDKNSVTLAVLREPKDDNYPIKSFHDLKGKKACFPEYGGLSWLSFINIARLSTVISTKSCDYPSLVSKLLSSACTPGIADPDHSLNPIPSDITSKLCSACSHQNNTSCAVNETNHYYGDKGVMQCLTEGAGDIAFVDIANIRNGDFDPNMYRVLCKNGKLNANTGFDVDEFCALSVTIDSEIVGRKKDTDLISRTDTILALLKMENWLGYRVDDRRPIHIFGPFNNTKDLLFKDSSSGLISTTSMKKTVLAYKQLFNHVEECTNGSFMATVNFIFIALVTLYHLLSSHVH